jgi:Cu/Ag efflux protein CusF
MTAKTTAILAVAVVLAVAGTLAQAPITKEQSVSGTATIQAIDKTARTITLRDEAGGQETYTVGPQVKRFDEFNVGDKVKITYYESVVLQVRKPGDTTKPARTTDVAGGTGSGQLPAAMIAVQDKATVTVKAIDPAVPSVTVTTPDGLTVTRRVENKKNIEGLKVGDQIDITFTRALLTNLERGK